jgi:hypothetical protein
VESNDVLYGGDADYVAEAQAIINKLLEGVLADITALSETEESDTTNKNNNVSKTCCIL